MPRHQSKIIYANDTTESVWFLLRLRLPWLLVGLIVGGITTIVASQFESVLQAEVRLAFFIPLIVYLSDAVGTQTETIFVRSVSKHNVGIKTMIKFLIKETMIGAALGAVCGSLVGVFAWVVFGSSAVALTVSLATLIGISTAPPIALVIAAVIRNYRQDPAVGAGPFTTVVQDLVSLMIYFLIASAIVL